MVKPASILGIVILAFAAVALAPLRVAAAGPPAAAVDRWPKYEVGDGATYTIFPPQIGAWEGGTITAQAAVVVLPHGARDALYGAITLTAGTQIDRVARTAYFTDPTVRGANFPTAPNEAASHRQTLQRLIASGPLTLPLDRLEAALVPIGVERKARVAAVENPVPRFVFSATSAVLVTIDGDPVWRPVAGTAYQRVVNTRSLLLRDAAGSVYFHLFDGFLVAPGLDGPWTVAGKVPRAIRKAATALAKAGAVDLMEKPPAPKEAPRPPKKSRAAAKIKPPPPAVIVATRPTELIVTDGPPDWVGIAGTRLLYIENTDANVFTDMGDRQAYLLVSGRWFTAPGLDGSWRYVPGKKLPASFREMPDDGPKENVKAAIPGTAQAKQALLTTLMSQTVTVDRSLARFTPQIAGKPLIAPVAGAALNYVVNSPMPLVQEPNGPWFGAHEGIWFTASALSGPWVVATAVPAAVYTIPVNSPLYYATYLQVHHASATTVTVGYLPGYLGVYAVADGTIVYGTGHAYQPYVGDATWYGGPVTYGYAAGLAWTPWTGWGFGFGMGWDYGPTWGLGVWGWSCAPWWGAYGGDGAWGARAAYGDWSPQAWAATSGNVYDQWGRNTPVTGSPSGYNAWSGRAWSAQVGHSYNSLTGELSAGQAGNVDNVFDENYANAPRPKKSRWKSWLPWNRARGAVGIAHAGPTGGGVRADDDYYADAQGNVYRHVASGWQLQGGSGGWSSAGAEGARAMAAQQQARALGERRALASAWGGGARGYGGAFRGLGDGVMDTDFRGQR